MRWLLWIYVVLVLGGVAANQAGWVSAEVGRQPWIVYPSVQDGVEMPGLHRSDGLSESVRAGQVAWSIGMFILIYGMLFVIWLYVFNSKIQRGPMAEASEPAPPTRERRGLLQSAAALAGKNASLLDSSERTARTREDERTELPREERP
jgi:cytochrome bd-type quinol oxidase subunit 1